MKLVIALIPRLSMSSTERMNAVDAAFRAWTVQDGDTYADIASRMLADSCEL